MTQPAPRVLIVDDDTDTLEMYTLALQAAGLSVDRATTGGEALALARAADPSVVVTDLTLPDVDGIELCAALRQAVNPLSAVIVLSGTSDAGQHARAREAGATQILTKPCLPSDLEREIRNALASQSRL